MSSGQAEPNGLEDEIPGEMAAEQGPRFLVGVLDDLPVTGQLIALILRTNLDCRVVVYTSASELLADEERVPDLYLLDIMLEGESGIEVCQKLRKDPRRCRVPVVFLSAHGKPEIRVAALKAGGSDYLDKPFYPEELLVRVKAQLALLAADERLEQELLRMRGELAEWEKQWHPLARDMLQFVRKVAAQEPSLAAEAGSLEQRLREFADEGGGAISTPGAWHPARFLLRGALQRAALRLEQECVKRGVQVQVACPDEAACFFDEEFFVETVMVGLLREALRRPLPGRGLLLEAGPATRAGKKGWEVYLCEGSLDQGSSGLLHGKRSRLHVVGVPGERGCSESLSCLCKTMTARGGDLECWHEPGLGPVVRVWVGE